MFQFEYGLLLLVLGANICISGSFYPALYLAVAFFHELGHILCMKRYGYPVRSIRFVGFGIAIDKSLLISYRQEMFVCLAGPANNFAAFAACMVLYYFFPVPFWMQAAFANLMYGILNILPIAPLDGYKILKDFIFLHCRYTSAVKIQKAVIVGGVMFLAIGLFLLLHFKVYNLSLLFIGLVLLINEIIFLIKE